MIKAFSNFILYTFFTPIFLDGMCHLTLDQNIYFVQAIYDKTMFVYITQR